MKARRTLIAILFLALALAAAPSIAFGAEPAEDGVLAVGVSTQDDGVIASGTWGSEGTGCPWEISSAGVLKVYPGQGGVSEPSWREYRSAIRSIVFVTVDNRKVIAPYSVVNMVSHLPNVTSIDFSGLDTSAVTDMSGMFYDCSSLASLDLSSLDTTNVTSMTRMFCDCSSLASIKLANFNTSAVTIMQGMFQGCSSLKSLDLSGFDTSAATEMSWMFEGCSSLESLDLTGFNTSSVTGVYAMFANCSSLTTLDLSGLDMSAATYMGPMFSNCSSLKSLNLAGLNTSSVQNMGGMFNNCSSLVSLDLSGLDTSDVSNMNSMFRGCSSLASLDLSGLDTSAVTDMTWMFDGCGKLSRVVLGKLFSFCDGAELPEGTWSGPGGKMSAADLVARYNGATMAGAYTRQIPADQGGAAISPVADKTNAGESIASEPYVNTATVTAADIRAMGWQTTVTLGPKVKKIEPGAFAGTGVTTVVLKTKKLAKKSVKDAFKGSSVKTVKVQVKDKKSLKGLKGTAKKKAKKANSKAAALNKQYAKKYKGFMTKKVVGKKVKVKA